MANNKMRVVDPSIITEIANKSNFNNNLNSEIEVSDTLFAQGLSIDILPVNVSDLQQVRHIKVQPNTSIPEHSHEGPIFRFITKGTAVVNGVTYSEGDWMLIPPKTKYKIESVDGYEALWLCLICGME